MSQRRSQFLADRHQKFAGGRTKCRRNDVRAEVLLESLFHALFSGREEAINVIDDWPQGKAMTLTDEGCHHRFEGVTMDIKVLMEPAAHEGGEFREEHLAFGGDDGHDQGAGYEVRTK